MKTGKVIINLIIISVSYYKIGNLVCCKVLSPIENYSYNQLFYTTKDNLINRCYQN